MKTVRPRETSCASFGTCWHEAPASPTVLTSLRAWGDALLCASPDTMAIMLIFAPLPKPAAQDPRQRVPPLIASARVLRPGSLHITAPCVQRPGELSRRSRTDQHEDVGPTAEPRANSPRHPSRQPACHCAGLVRLAGSFAVKARSVISVPTTRDAW